MRESISVHQEYAIFGRSVLFSTERDDYLLMDFSNISSGTGLLVMLASRYNMNTSQKIEETSVERSSAMEKIVRITIEPNNVQDEIQIVEGNSCDPSSIPYLLPGHTADIFYL